MQKYDKIKEYLINIDFDMIETSDLLANVYREIDSFEEQLLLDLDVVSNFELLIKKSSISQILTLCKKLNLPKISTKKTGSKFIEIVILQINNFKCNKKELKKLKNVVIDPIDEKFDFLICDKNGTHVIRQYFELLKNKNIEKKYKREILEILMKHKIALDDEKFKLENSSFEVVNKKSKRSNEKKLVVKNLKNHLEIDVLVTIICYLKFCYSKSITRKIVEIFFNADNCKNKIFSYIFEDLINLSDKKTLKDIFEIFKPCFLDLINDNISVFVVLALIKKHIVETDFYYEHMANLQNTNIILKILENYVILKKYDKVDEIFKKYFGIEENVFKNFLLSRTDSPDTKFINLICLLMEDDKYFVNKDFCKFYNMEWIHRKFGICLTKAFFEGGANKQMKIEFARKFNFTRSLNVKKDGQKIISLIKSYKNLVK